MSGCGCEEKMMRWVSIYTAVLLVCALIGDGIAQSASGVYASYHIYKPDAIAWDLNTASTYCSTWDGMKPLEWRKKYGWTAFCHGAATQGEGVCGSCLKVTNPATSAQQTVRIVDKCANGGLDLEEGVFRALDTNGVGFNQGHLSVNYEFVDCRD